MKPELPFTGFVKKNILAMKYFPEAPSKRAATDNLTRAINRCTPLSEALSEAHYLPNSKEFTPRQVSLIYEYLGEP